MRFLKDNGLTLALLGAFLFCLGGMLVAGWHSHNEELVQHHAALISFWQYAVSGEFISAVFENWESEFLQMSAYVVLTAYLFQRGSAESRDPDGGERVGDDLAYIPFRSHPFGGFLYSHSLGIILALLFVASFILHWLGSVSAANEEAMLHGGELKTAFAHLLDARLWFESLQNWQSEFLSTAVLVVLSIFLRYRGSPESKPVAAPDSETGG
jgi:hypothetical protein